MPQHSSNTRRDSEYRPVTLIASAAPYRALAKNSPSVAYSSPSLMSFITLSHTSIAALCSPFCPSNSAIRTCSATGRGRPPFSIAPIFFSSIPSNASSRPSSSSLQSASTISNPALYCILASCTSPASSATIPLSSTSSTTCRRLFCDALTTSSIDSEQRYSCKYHSASLERTSCIADWGMCFPHAPPNEFVIAFFKRETLCKATRSTASAEALRVCSIVFDMQLRVTRRV
mmetsp:Transcript_25893/g.60138  ORF Transcript_25893/g.60138 Transcript_25893/m.60138 type:complete len:231 (-) Transcript_25893:1500-2192(-)